MGRADMTQPRTPGTAVEPPLIPERVLRFMNALPTTGDAVEWMNQFREGLKELLGDVDRVACSVNVACELDAPEKSLPGLNVLINTNRQHPIPVSDPTIPGWNHEPRAQDLLMEFQRLGYPLDDYQEPSSFDYYLDEHAYLGTIFLFRRRGREPVSEQTLQAMEALEPFLIYAFSSLVTRHSFIKPVDRMFIRLLNRIRVSARLTVREVQVMILHLMGLSYAQIAHQLFLSEHSIAKYVKSAHRKTGCYSFLELFTPYFRVAAEESEG